MSGVFENVRCIFKNKLGDLSVKTVFDSGFYDDFDMAPDLHAHGYYELLFSLEEGFLLELADGATVNIPTGASCLIPPGTYHGTRQLGERSKKLALRFRYVEEPEECGESLYFQFDKAFSKCKDVKLFLNDSDISDILSALYREFCCPKAATKEYITTLLNQLYILLMRKNDEGAVDAENHTLVDDINDVDNRRLWVEEYFYRYYRDPITEEHMAERLYLSRRQVSRILQEIYGKSFRQILIEMRLNRAAQLLLSTEKPIDDIAEAVGYSSLSGFHAAFYRKFGLSAGQYRKEFLQNF